jgi:hypothetical protein
MKLHDGQDVWIRFVVLSHIEARDKYGIHEYTLVSAFAPPVRRFLESSLESSDIVVGELVPEKDKNGK